MKQNTKEFLKKRTKELLVAVMFAVYILTVIIFYRRAGNLIFVVNALPALCVAALFGLEKAMLTYVPCLLLDLLLHQFLTTQNFYSAETLVGIGIALVITLLVGRVKDMNGTMQELQKEIVQLSRLDPLTNLLNRGTLLEFAEQEFKQIARLHFAYHEAKTKKTLPEIFSLAIIDIDSFKEINEQHGHAAGDEVLRTMGDVLSSFGLLRGSDLKGRYGGKEFLLILPHTVSKHAAIPLKKLGEEIKSIQFFSGDDRNFTTTFTCGVSQYNENDRGIEDTVKRAEEALASAKAKGRDRIAIYETMENMNVTKVAKVS
ncbi:MAG: GGDEF domain-containing protein [bacterium]|nr:GGDEF domain-containing protein [bacterium]